MFRGKPCDIPTPDIEWRAKNGFTDSDFPKILRSICESFQSLAMTPSYFVEILVYSAAANGDGFETFAMICTSIRRT